MIVSAGAVWSAVTLRLEVVLGEAGTIHPRGRSIRNNRRTPTAVTMSEPNVKCDARLILYVPGCTAFCGAYQSSVANEYGTGGVENQTKPRREENRRKRMTGTEPASSTSRLGGAAVRAN